MYRKYDICIEGIHRYHFNSKRTIGKGKYSNVYTGIIEDTKEKVAVKRICLKKILPSEKIVIDREISAISKLMCIEQNKNILKYYDIIRTNIYVYIIMEYCINGNLSSILIKPIKEEYIKYYFKQIVNGVYWLHKNNIIHNDIKPDNILITDDYKTLKICDFGFSNIKNNNNIICGTPIYMAPELLTNINSGKCADIWSLGIILYELIYGYNPYINVKDIQTKTIKNIKIIKNKNISKNGINILKQLLMYNYRSRIDIDNIIINSWLKMVIKIDDVILSSIYYRPNSNNISHSMPELSQNIKINNNKNKSLINCYDINNVLFRGYLENIEYTNKIDINGYIYEDIKIEDKDNELIFSIDI